MKSIDKLREWANGLHGVYVNKVDHTITVTTGWDAPPDMDSVSLRDHVNGILDGIEREVADMVPLPVDADGEPIHARDMLDGYGKNIEVVELRYGRSGWVIVSRDGNAYADCAAFSHHHTPTVEDVLREFAYGLGVPVADSYVAATAAKLRLKEG